MSSVQYSVLSIQKKIVRGLRLFCIASGILVMQKYNALTLEQNENLNNGWRLTPSSFFENHAEGWHWYQSQETGVRDQESGKKEEKKSSQTPTQVIEEQRKELETKLHAAILEPTQANLMSYITAQKALMDQSQRFSEMWKQVVMTTPSLDETLTHPVDQNAQHIYYGEKNKELAGRIKALSAEYGLFFFFKGKCPYCHHFAPIVKHFAQKHGWSVLGISMDGGTLAEFPNARLNNGIAIRLQVAHVPALIAFHPKSDTMIPLAYGMVSESEIEERINLLTRTFDLGGKK